MESTLLDIFIFLLGLIIGSFLNCVIYRIEVKKSFLKGRSICPKCKHTLAWYDLIPILSFLTLEGKCRYCKKPISWQYPAVEFLTAAVFVWIFYFFGLPAAVFYWIIASLLIIAFIYDLKHFIIPDRITFLGILLVLMFRIKDATYLEAAFGAMLFFLAIYLISRGKWMGFGDVKLAFLMGLLLGFPNILTALFFSFMIGAIAGIGLIAAKKKKLKSEVPFGPFLVAGTFIALFWGQQIIQWYINLLKI